MKKIVLTMIAILSMTVAMAQNDCHPVNDGCYGTE